MLQQNSLVLSCGCQLAQFDVYNSHKTVAIGDSMLLMLFLLLQLWLPAVDGLCRMSWEHVRNVQQNMRRLSPVTKN